MKINFALIILAAFLASACSSMKITADYDKAADFTKYKTISFYGWAKESENLLSKFDKERIEKSFANEFSKRGFSFVDKGGDLVVSLYIVVDQKTGTTAYTNHYGNRGYGYYSPWAWGMGYSTTTYHDYDYQVGTLICDVFDATSKELIWQGVASGEINEDPKNRERNIPRVVSAIMGKYPIPPAKK
jgi:hypothetical protein